MSDKEKTSTPNVAGGLFQTNSNLDSASTISKSVLSDERTGMADNILTGYSEDETMQIGRDYAKEHGLDEELFAKAAAVARFPNGFNSMEFISEEEKQSLQYELDHPYAIPKTLIWLVATASMAACVQGMDETVINGANLFFPSAFGIASGSDRDSWLLGLVNCAPYLCAATMSVWCTDFMNDKFSRKGTIFICCVWGTLCCIWSALTNNWWHLFIARFFLGFAIGPNSTTVPIYTSECAPARIRGALVMNWQIWTAFGIMLGYVFSLAFYRIPDRGIGEGLSWRLMLGSACLPSIVILFQIPFCPESPRWLIGKDRHTDAFNSFSKLRSSELQAARDHFYAYISIVQEGESKGSFFNKIKEMFTVRRNRNGALGAWVCMFMQQFCGINVIAYYSSTIFKESGFSERDALIASWGFGMLNWVFALPAVFMIDKFGRRTLLLVAFPLMGGFLLLAGFAFWIPEDNNNARIGVIALGIYLFTIVYSSSEGPVPFTYSAECASLKVRDVTMSFATATCWFFNFILSLTWPSLLKAFKPQGAFGWYAAWNIVGFFLALWLLPETKGLTLEELDRVFDVPIYKHASYQNRALWNNIERYVLRRNVPEIAPLYAQHQLSIPDDWEKQQTSHVE